MISIDINKIQLQTNIQNWLTTQKLILSIFFTIFKLFSTWPFFSAKTMISIDINKIQWIQLQTNIQNWLTTDSRTNSLHFHYDDSCRRFSKRFFKLFLQRCPYFASETVTSPLSNAYFSITVGWNERTRRESSF